MAHSVPGVGASAAVACAWRGRASRCPRSRNVSFAVNHSSRVEIHAQVFPTGMIAPLSRHSPRLVYSLDDRTGHIVLTDDPSGEGELRKAGAPGCTSRDPPILRHRVIDPAEELRLAGRPSGGIGNAIDRLLWAANLYCHLDDDLSKFRCGEICKFKVGFRPEDPPANKIVFGSSLDHLNVVRTVGIDADEAKDLGLQVPLETLAECESPIRDDSTGEVDNLNARVGTRAEDRGEESVLGRSLYVPADPDAMI